MNMTTTVVPAMPAPLANGNRCEACLGEGARASLDRIQDEFPFVSRFDEVGLCGACGQMRAVYDVAFLLIQRWRGSLVDDPERPDLFARLRPQDIEQAVVN